MYLMTIVIFLDFIYFYLIFYTQLCPGRNTGSKMLTTCKISYTPTLVYICSELRKRREMNKVKFEKSKIYEHEKKEDPKPQSRSEQVSKK